MKLIQSAIWKLNVSTHVLLVASLETVQKASHKDFVCQFNQEIARVETNGHNAINVESESSLIRSAAGRRENDPSTDKTSQTINLWFQSG